MNIQQQIDTLNQLLIQEKQIQLQQLVCLTNLHRLLTVEVTAGRSKLSTRQLGAFGNLIEDLKIGLSATAVSRVSLAMAFSAAMTLVDSFNLEH